MKNLIAAAAVAFLLLHEAAEARFPQFHLTFRPFGASDPQPTSVWAAEHWKGPYPYAWRPMDQGNSCKGQLGHSQWRFAGERWFPDTYDEPILSIIYDIDGHMAGTQSFVPVEDFLYGDCTQNKYYTKETLFFSEGRSREFCVSTMYFRHPSTICQKDSDAEDHLYMQNGANFETDLVPIPRNWAEARNNDWFILDKYIVGMGHHITQELHGSNDCKNFFPFQGLYAYVDGECRNTGFVWTHLKSNVTDVNNFSPHGSQWETSTKFVVGAILSKPAQCEYDTAEEGLLKSQHVFLGGSTTYCFTD